MTRYYLRLVKDPNVQWECRAHFFGAAAEAMRRILVERARQVAGPRRGGGRKRVPIPVGELAFEHDAVELLALHEALTEMEKQDRRLSTVVKLRYFAGLTVDEVAAALGLSNRTVMRDWSFARAWLRKRLAGQPAQRIEGRRRATG